MLTCVTFSALYLLAVAGWVRTHFDLLAHDWFRRHRGARWGAGLAGPAAALAGVLVLAGEAACRQPAGAAVATAVSLAAAGLSLLIARPFKKEPALVPVETVDRR